MEFANEEPCSSTPASSTQEVKRNKRGGHACCIPTCSSRQYINNAKTEIGLFTIPTDMKLRKSWTRFIHTYRRKSGADKFNIDNARVCEFHFKREEIKKSLGRGIKTLTKNAIPSVFDITTEEEPRTGRKPPKVRILDCLQQCEDINDYEIENEIEETIYDRETENEVRNCKNCIENTLAILTLKCENQALHEKIKKLEKKNTELASERDALSKSTFNYENISENDMLFRSSTGLEKATFDELFTILDTGEQCDYDGGNNKAYNNNFNQDCPSKKPGPKPKLEAIEQLFMYVLDQKCSYIVSLMCHGCLTHR